MRALQAKSTTFLMTAVAICLLAGLVGCGKKGWPEPRVEEDRYQWAQIQHHRYGQCLDARALLEGESSNLRFVYLEWMELEGREDCPGCEFKLTGRVRLDDATEEFKRQNGVIRILFCGWDPDVSYRWRLTGANIHRGLGFTSSPVQFSR